MRHADRASARSAEKVARKIAAWKREPPFEELVEADRHKPDANLGGLTRAQADDWLRGILSSSWD